MANDLSVCHIFSLKPWPTAIITDSSFDVYYQHILMYGTWNQNSNIFFQKIVYENIYKIAISFQFIGCEFAFENLFFLVLLPFYLFIFQISPFQHFSNEQGTSPYKFNSPFRASFSAAHLSVTLGSRVMNGVTAVTFTLANKPRHDWVICNSGRWGCKGYPLQPHFPGLQITNTSCLWVILLRLLQPSLVYRRNYLIANYCN